MKIVKVLFLDQLDYFFLISGNKNNIIRKSKNSDSVKFEIVSNKFLDDCYSEKEKIAQEMPMYSDDAEYFSGFKETIKDFTENKKVDIIIIGNNRGAGVFKAEAVADDMKDKTIIVWHDLCGDEFDERDEQEKTWPYRRLGFKCFALRRDMKQAVLKVISS